MSGLRESKKAATRATLARAAASLALDRGAEGATVAAVAAAAGVSTRTFHNYFDSMEQALVEFILGRVSALADQLNGLPDDVGLFDAVQAVVIDGLERRHGALDSFATLFRISDVLQTLTGAQDRPGLSAHLRPIFETVRPRAGGARRVWFPGGSQRCGRGGAHRPRNLLRPARATGPGGRRGSGAPRVQRTALSVTTMPSASA